MEHKTQTSWLKSKAAEEWARLYSGKDLHRQAAAERFGVPYDQVTPEQRRAAKALAFGETYGITK